ncbi:hypothetical protein N7462_004751 [Penicillium macrosclerotiorum]|uniref:uncharacterized protein n=1 Tax=Penicillium macrosclerotiorum TaxID=303699 RepID=UPI0025473FDC|nr:uncharacterized protein N7462_004751 [Penicillium macrosclerotiorum]KAJ5690359.1 hypothetical protein N7462_004751 [Penicillium macrosclerotiorum]
MESKRRRLVAPISYNRLPAPDTDLDICFRWEMFSIRLVYSKMSSAVSPAISKLESLIRAIGTNSQEWGLPESAKILAAHTLETTPENEQLLRTHHPALGLHDEVYVSHPQYGPEVWLVRGLWTDTKAGGRALHPFPEDRKDLYPRGILASRSPLKEEYLFKEGINPRKFLSPEQLERLRELFPAAIGARVLVAGFLVMLFGSPSDIREIYETDWIMELGGLRTIYDVPRVKVSSDTIASGMEASETPKSLNGSGCLGLKLRMPDGKEVVTTVTHGFVRNPRPSRVVSMFSDWISWTKSALRRFVRKSDACALGVARKSQTNSPIGKEVWLATEKKRIGTISQTFDDPSPVLPYPAGYRHDLSLITDDDLPALVSPPGYPVVSEWASYSTALAGSDVYVVRMNTVVGKWRLLRGIIDPNAIRNATVIGTEYVWDRTAGSQNASLLWTATEPFTPTIGWSGSVLCLGRPTDRSSMAVVFQNFEEDFYSFINPMTGESTEVIVKGGFLLPESVRSSTIISSKDQHRPRDSNTYPRHSREREEPDRRVFLAV